MKHDRFKHHRRSIRLKDYDYAHAGVYFVTIASHNRECIFGAIQDAEMRLNDFGRIVTECWDEIPRHFPNVELDAFVVMPNHVHGIIVIAGNVGATHASPLRNAPPQPGASWCQTVPGADAALPDASPVRNPSPQQDASFCQTVPGADAGLPDASLSRTPPPTGVEIEGNVRATHASPLRDASPTETPHPHGPQSRSIAAIVGSFKSATSRRINELRDARGARIWQRNYYEHIVRDEHALNQIRQYVANNPGNWDTDVENPDACR